MPFKLFAGFSDRHGENWSEVIDLQAGALYSAIEEAVAICLEKAPDGDTETYCHHASVAEVVGEPTKLEVYR